MEENHINFAFKFRKISWNNLLPSKSQIVAENPTVFVLMAKTQPICCIKKWRWKVPRRTVENRISLRSTCKFINYFNVEELLNFTVNDTVLLLKIPQPVSGTFVVVVALLYLHPYRTPKLITNNHRLWWYMGLRWM
jgi:hypothetical protein